MTIQESMVITDEQLKYIYPRSTKTNRAKYLPYINLFAGRFGINTPDRMAVFLAQTGHESGQLRYVEEIASGAAYEGRKDLGNIVKGDGKLFKGRGLIQITGRANYTLFDKWLHDRRYLQPDVSVVDTPDLVSNDPKLAVLSAFWYWERHKLANLSDKPV